MNANKTNRTNAVEVKLVDKIGIITLNRATVSNCLSLELLDQIDTAVSDIIANKESKVILVTAKGSNFCTGADIVELERFHQKESALREFIDKGNSVFNNLESCQLPIVAAVQGLCLAGGLELILACDVIFASRNAKLGDQHAKFGFVPGWGGGRRLIRTIGLKRGLDLMYSARWYSAKEALEAGLVSYVVADKLLFTETMEYCQKLSTRSLKGLSVMKKMSYEAVRLNLADGLDFEKQLAIEHLQSIDAKEGLAAFKENRNPVFTKEQE